MSAIPPNLLQKLRELDTSLLANTISAIDPTPAAEFYLARSITAALPELGPTVGIAATVEIDSSSPGGRDEREVWWQLLAAIQEMTAPVILVAKAVGSRPEHECMIGDGMAKILHSVGCVGLVTDGGVRDVEELANIPFAAYSVGRTVHHGPMRFKRMGCPIEVGGVTVSPGDLIHASVAGVIRIPPGCLPALPERAEAYLRYESELHEFYRQTKITLEEKRKIGPVLKAKFGFGSPTPR